MFSSVYLPSLTGLVGLAATLAVGAAFVCVGALVVPRCERAEETFAAGYGLVLLIVTAVGTVVAVPLTWFAAAFAVAAIGGAVRIARGRGPDLGEVARAVVLAAPLLLLMAGSTPSQWDEFSNWLPKHRYLLEFDSFARAGLPPSTSALPAYPDGLPLIGYFVGRLAGGFVENAGALFNTLLIPIAALLLARLIAAGAEDASRPKPLSWGALALGSLAATLLNPTFVPKLVFTAYLDWTTAVLLALFAAAGWRAVEALASNDEAAARQSALIAGLTLTAFLDLKQPNLVLAGLVFIGLAIAVLRAPGRPVGAAFKLLPAMIVPAAVIYIAWRLFVRANIPGGEFSFAPFDQWLWSHWLDIAGRMLKIASTKGGYFAVMIVLTIIALRALVRPTPFGRLAIVIATVFLGYNVFLYVTYVGAFGEYEGLRAASYWRYNTQLGVLAVAGAAHGLAILWRNYPEHRLTRAVAHPAAAALAIILILAAPVAQASRIRFDVNPARAFMRGLEADLKASVPQGSTVVVVDRGDFGMWALVVRYELGRHADVRGLYGDLVGDPQALRAALAREPSGPYLFVHVPEASIETALGVSLPPRASSLIAPAGEGWRLIKSWPWPGYDNPHRYDKS